MFACSTNIFSNLIHISHGITTKTDVFFLLCTFLWWTHIESQRAVNYWGFFFWWYWNVSSSCDKLNSYKGNIIQVCTLFFFFLLWVHSTKKKFHCFFAAAKGLLYVINQLDKRKRLQVCERASEHVYAWVCGYILCSKRIDEFYVVFFFGSLRAPHKNLSVYIFAQ